MNIQQYYQKTASISLNASLASLLPPFFLVMYGIIVAPQGMMVFIVMPFLLYSFICFQFYLVNDKRSKEVVRKRDEVKKTSTLMKENMVLINFMPAPSLRMLLFGPDGSLIGEIKDIKYWPFRWFMPYFLDRLFARKYGIYDESSRLLAMITLKNNIIEIADAGQTMKSKIVQMPSRKNSEFIFQKDDNRLIVKRSFLYTDYQFHRDEYTKVGRLQKGWMPLEWGKRFKDPNTPILSFEPGLIEEDKLAMLAILSAFFRYSNH